SRDGKSLLYLSNRRDLKFVDLYEYDLASGKSKLVWQAAGKIAFATASHDHQRIALIETISDVDSNIYLADGGKRRLRTPHQGHVLYGPADFTRDGAALLTTSDEGGEFQALLSLDLASGKQSPVLATDWDVEAAGFSPAFKYSFTQVNADGAPRLELKDA